MKWNIDYIEHAAKAILYLLRDRFLVATDYDQMRKVFLEEPCLLHTADVQSAFIHLAIKKADPRAIPAMNQRYYPNKASDQLRTDHKLIPNRKQTFLETIGVKDISLTLSIPSNLQLVRRKPKERKKFVFSSTLRTLEQNKILIFVQLLSKFKFTEVERKLVMFQRDLYLFFVRFQSIRLSFKSLIGFYFL